jgi:hypothetical protein
MRLQEQLSPTQTIQSTGFYAAVFVCVYGKNIKIFCSQSIFWKPKQNWQPFQRLNWKKICGKTSLKAGHAPQPDLSNHGLVCICITFKIHLQIHKHLGVLRMQVMQFPKTFVTPECMHMDLPMNCVGGYLLCPRGSDFFLSIFWSCIIG